MPSSSMQLPDQLDVSSASGLELLLRKRPREDAGKQIKVSVFSGGEGSTLPWFEQAMAAFRRHHNLSYDAIHVEYATNKTVRENNCGRFEKPCNLIDWLLKSDAYFIVSQGIWLGMNNSGALGEGWDVTGIAGAIGSLQMAEGNGYPSKEQLDCPVWNGDKIRYINLIPLYIIPTMQIDLCNIKGDVVDGNLMKAIQRWIIDNDYGSGWFIKVPYTANGLSYYCRSYLTCSDILEEINRTLKIGLKNMFPYLILQPTVPDPKEYKVIIYNGICQYFHQRGRSCLKCPKLGTEEAVEVMAFAKEVYEELAFRTKRIILNGLMRIDIMRVRTKWDQKGFLKVNEVEGIDSAYGAPNHHLEIKTQDFLKQFWYNLISEKLSSLL